MPLIYLIAGEQSGDQLGARLMRAILRRRPDATFAGIGGTAMAAQGCASLFPMSDLSVMGLLEVLPRLRQLKRRIRETADDIAAKRPAVVVTIDSPGFTLRVLRIIAPLGIPRAHYVAPQVWAWREGRVKHYPGLWERLLCLLPFEPAFFARHNLPAIFVGHPVLESGCDMGDAARFRTRHNLAPEDRVLIVMPGSRRTEIKRLLPVLRATLEQLREPVVPVIPLAGPVADAVTAATSTWTKQPILISESADKHDAFAAAAAALTKSGTSTLELALAGVPMVVTYRTNPITGWILRRVLLVKYASLLNLLSGREIVPELMQGDATPENLAAALEKILTPEGAAAQRATFAAPLAMLRAPDGTQGGTPMGTPVGTPVGTPMGTPVGTPVGTPSDAAAAAVLDLIEQPARDHPGA